MGYLFCTNNLLTKAFKNFKTDNVCNTFWEKFYLPLSLFIWGGVLGSPTYLVYFFEILLALVCI